MATYAHDRGCEPPTQQDGDGAGERASKQAGCPSDDVGAAALAVPPGDVLPGADGDWASLLGTLAEIVDVEKSARAWGAFRRKRELRSAGGLLRLCFGYAVGDQTLQQVVAWAAMRGLATLTDAAVVKRLVQARAWLASLLAAVLLAGQPEWTRRDADGGRVWTRPQRRVVLVDGTVITVPGSVGTDWRVHACLDLATLQITDLQVTDQHGGERLSRHVWQPGDLAVGDRGFCRTGGILAVLAAQADVVVRVHPTSVRLETEVAGTAFALLPWLPSTPTTTVQECPVWLVSGRRRHPLRLIALALPDAQAEVARDQLRRQASKHSRAASPDSLVLAGWVLLLTRVSGHAWPATDLLALYRCRWQVELLFKRLKGLWHLDHVRARSPEMVQTYLLAKLLAVLLADRLVAPAHDALDAWTEATELPLTLWRWTQTCVTLVTAAILGPISREHFLAALPRLQRSLCDRPRKRQRQAVTVQRLLSPPAPACAA